MLQGTGQLLYHLRSFANGRYLNVIFARSIKESVFSQTVLTASVNNTTSLLTKANLKPTSRSFRRKHWQSGSHSSSSNLHLPKIHLYPFPNHHPAPNVTQPQAAVLNQLLRSRNLLYPPLMPTPHLHPPKHHPPIFSPKLLPLMAVLCSAHLQPMPQHQQHQGLSTSGLKSSTLTRKLNSNSTEPSKVSAKLQKTFQRMNKHRYKTKQQHMVYQCLWQLKRRTPSLSRSFVQRLL